MTHVRIVAAACAAAVNSSGCLLEVRAEASPDRASWISQRDRAIDPQEQAAFNARLASDAIERAVRTHHAWMARRVESTGLFPQSPENAQFNYQNVAADFLCFQYAIAEYAGLPTRAAVKQTFAREREFQKAAAAKWYPDQPDIRLCMRLDAQTGEAVKTGFRDELFGTSEYLKDGLIGLFERTGDPDVLARIIELCDAIERVSRVKSTFGEIPSDNSEVNGNVLQTFSRVAFAIRRKDPDRAAKYADLAARIADAMLLQMFPETGGLPAMVFDFAADNSIKATDARVSAVQLRDHGNETFVGLSEVFAVAVAMSADEPAWRARADAWVEPLAKMYEVVLERAVNEDGLLVSRVDRATLAHRDPRPCDTWGYLVIGALCFADAAERHGALGSARREHIQHRCDDIARAVMKTDNVLWQADPKNRARPHHDGWADTIESAIYVAHRRAGLRDALLTWCDRQIGYMFDLQRPDGFVSDDYLDGNFIRTAMLYAEARSGGWVTTPWQPQVSVGWDGTGTVVCDSRVEFDGAVLCRPNGAFTHLGLAWDWPRLNSWPTWINTPGRVDVSVEARERRVLRAP